MNQRLPRSLRVHQSSEIRSILKAGRKYTGTHLILYFLPETNRPGAPARAGFLTPKRIGKAARRNRVRRWMREAFRRHRDEMSGSPQLLMMGRTSATQAGYTAVLDDFLQLCRKARLLPPRDP